MSFKWEDDIEEPMNPFAEEDFRNAIADEAKRLNESFKKIGKQMKVNPPLTKDDVPYINFDDMPTEYSGVMRLCYCNGRGAWQDVVFTLIAHGYEVTVWLEDATETEKELDGADKFVVIEYGEVE